ncbi:hypothetical protein BC830DRAFT_1098370 [Chytriomyces sp. MP71]|nr:hypothetical protein BC830DRAFT_1098370 [Chytriomyces sp. MP71]
MMIGRRPTVRRMGQLFMLFVMVMITLLLMRINFGIGDSGGSSLGRWVQNYTHSQSSWMLNAIKRIGVPTGIEHVPVPDGPTVSIEVARPSEISPVDTHAPSVGNENARVQDEAQDRVDPHSSDTLGPNLVTQNDTKKDEFFDETKVNLAIDQDDVLTDQKEAANQGLPDTSFNSSVSSLGAERNVMIPRDMIFTPSPNERPLKSKAVITFLAQASREDWKLFPLRDPDWFFVGACLHAYTFCHRTDTKIKDQDDTEFVVMVTEFVPQAFRDALSLLGARVLAVPSIEIKGREKPGDKYQYLYTKLNMYRLENVYDAILFLDVDINYFHQSPVALFEFFNPNQNVEHSYFFGSTREWQDGNGIFNTGVQLLKPSVYHYDSMLKLALDPQGSRYGDQGLLNVYFASTGPHPWTELPQIWNTNHLEVRNATEVESARGFHGKFWSECRFLSAGARGMFSVWAEAMAATRAVQVEILRQVAPGLVGMSLVPLVPGGDCSKWMQITGMTTQKYQTSMSTFAVLSMGTISDAVHKSRDAFCRTFAFAPHYVEPGHTRTMFATLEYALESLLPRYDFVWILSPHVVMRDPHHLERLFLTDFRDMRKRAGLGDVIYAFRDCEHALTGSVILANEGAHKLKQFLERVRSTGQNINDDDVVWELFIQLFTGNGGRATLQVFDRSPWYDFDADHCSTFFHLKNFGMAQENLYQKIPSVPNRGVEFAESAQLPSEFQLFPPLSDRPAKPKAIITLLAVAAQDYGTKYLQDSDWFFTGALLNAYTFYHKPATKLDPSGDVEFVVMVTPAVPQSYVLAFLNLGARVLVVPAVEIPGREKPGDKYQYVYTKLQMQRLEAIYRGVLYIDIDLFYFDHSPVALFDYLNNHIERAHTNVSMEPYFFGSTAEWKQHERRWGQFNSGLQMFTPSLRQFNRLFEYAKDPDYARYGDQGLLTKYFEDNWVQLPQKYNTHHLEERNASTMEPAIGFHHKYWCDCHYMTEASAPSFLLWVRDAQEVRRIQMSQLAQATGEIPDIPIMPIIPADCQMWKKLVPEALKQKVLFDTIVVVSLDNVSPEEKERRDKWCSTYHQANHDFGIAAKSVIQVLQRVMMLLGKYDWVWVLDSKVKIDEATKPFSLNLAKFKDSVSPVRVVAFADCGKEASGSILFSKESLTKLRDISASMESSGNLEVPWRDLFSLVMAKHKDGIRVISDRHDLYRFDQIDCTEFVILN